MLLNTRFRTDPMTDQSRPGMVAALRRFAMYRGLPAEVEARIAAASMICRHAARSTLYHHGMAVNTVHALISGRLRAQMTAPEGSVCILADAGPHTWCGHNALRAAGAAFDLEVLDPSVVLHTPTPVIWETAEIFPALMRRLLEELDLQRNNLALLLKLHTQYSLESRVATSLVRFVEQYGRRTPQGVRFSERHTQTELAEYSGGSRQTTNRILKAWEAQGLLRFDGNELVVLDVESLRAIADTRQPALRPCAALVSAR